MKCRRIDRSHWTGRLLSMRYHLGPSITHCALATVRPCIIWAMHYLELSLDLAIDVNGPVSAWGLSASARSPEVGGNGPVHLVCEPRLDVCKLMLLRSAGCFAAAAVSQAHVRQGDGLDLMAGSFRMRVISLWQDPPHHQRQWPECGSAYQRCESSPLKTISAERNLLALPSAISIQMDQSCSD